MNTFSRLSRIAGLTLASALTAALLLSCEEKEPVPVTIDSQPSQIAAEGGSTSFTVTAPGTWTAAVQPASDGTAAAWLTIDPASGEAGEHTVTLTAEANTAGEERTATIIVTSGSSSVTVSVSQAGATAQDEPEEPDEPDIPDHTGLVKSVEFSQSEGEYGWSYYFNFGYDDLNRVSSVQVITGEYSDETAYTGTFTYNEDGSATFERSMYGETEIMNILFDSDGKATEATSESYSFNFSYNDKGQLQSIEDVLGIYDYDYDAEFDFEWNDEDNIKVISRNDREDVYDIPFSEYENTINIDINWLASWKSLIYIHSPIQFMGAAGMLGQRDAHYAVPADASDNYTSPDDISMPENYPYYPGLDERPDVDGNVLYSSTSYYYLPEESTLEYDIDSDGLLHSIRYEMPLHEVTITCKCRIIVTDNNTGEGYLEPIEEPTRTDQPAGYSHITTVNVAYY